MSLSELTKHWVARRLPERPGNANKGTFGKVLVIAGSQNYPGAAYLVCAAAYRVGAGLVTLATTPLVQNIISKKLPEVTFLSLDEVSGKIGKYDVLLIGPGLGQTDQAVESTVKLYSDYSNNRIKTIIDGDGLNILAKMDRWWEMLSGEVVLTPHPGEMSRLTGMSIDDIQKDREDIARRFSKKWNQVVVLKGANSVIVSPAGEVRVSPFANPALATAGTGDVLSGIIAGFIAQGLKLFDAACCGVYIHAMAGELISKKIGDAGMLASDLLLILPKTMQKLKNNYST